MSPGRIIPEGSKRSTAYGASVALRHCPLNRAFRALRSPPRTQRHRPKQASKGDDLDGGITPPRQQLLSEPSVDLWREIGEKGGWGSGGMRPVAVKAKIFGDCGAVSR